MGRRLPIGYVRLVTTRLYDAESQDLELPFDGFRRPSSLLRTWLLFCYSHLPLRNPNHQVLWHGKIAPGAQGYPVSRESPPAIHNAMEGVRDLEETIWKVHPNNPWLSLLILFSIQDPWYTSRWAAKESSSSTHTKLQRTYWTVEDIFIVIVLA